MKITNIKKQLYPDTFTPYISFNAELSMESINELARVSHTGTCEIIGELILNAINEEFKKGND